MNAQRLAALAAALWASAASATTLVALDLDALTSGSDAVVQGKVKRVESRWSGDGHRIITDVEIEVADSLKGEASRTVVVTQPGGVVGDIGQRVSGLASFDPGEEVVLFLEKRPDERYLVSGMAQGKLKVVRSSDGKSVFAVPDPGASDARLLNPTTHREVAAKVEPLELDALKAKVRAAVKAGGPKRVAPGTGRSNSPATPAVPDPVRKKAP